MGDVDYHNAHSCSDFDAWADPLDLQGTSASLAYFAGMAYMFFAVHLVCERYFVPAIERISQVVGLKDDVAGHLMAAGTSAPELISESSESSSRAPATSASAPCEATSSTPSSSSGCAPWCAPTRQARIGAVLLP